mgnify:CR=1 FL=1
MSECEYMSFWDYSEMMDKVRKQMMWISFADYVETLRGVKYSKEWKQQLNDIFMTRSESLKPRRKDGQSTKRAVLSALTQQYEQLIFEAIRREIEEQYYKYSHLKQALR